MRILRQSEVGVIRMVTLSLLLILTEITMTTGSVTMEMELFVPKYNALIFGGEKVSS